jgi:hypothetical protein
MNIIAQKLTERHLLAAALLVIGLLMNGCYLASIHPLAEQDQRVFDPKLIGTWAAGHDTLSISGETIDNMSLRVCEGPGIISDSSRAGDLTILLTRIGDKTFMDLKPGDELKASMPTMEAMLLVPMHTFIRYSISHDTLVVQSLNYSEFSERMKKGRWHGLDLERIEDGGPLLITSSTAEIRKFLTSREGEGLYADPVYYLRVR